MGSEKGPAARACARVGVCSVPARAAGPFFDNPLRPRLGPTAISNPSCPVGADRDQHLRCPGRTPDRDRQSAVPRSGADSDQQSAVLPIRGPISSSAIEIPVRRLPLRRTVTHCTTG